jgi:hypothetical protein
MFDIKRPRRCATTPGPADWLGVDMTGRTCSVEGCPREDIVGYDGLCRKHYGRKRKTGSIELRERPKLACSVETCNARVKGLGLCSSHHGRLLRTGDVQADVPIRKLRELGDSKPCTKCDVVKALDDFAPDSRRRDGRQAHCRECVKAYQKRYRQDDRERYLALKKAEYERSKDARRAYQEANRERLNVWRKSWEASLPPERVEERKPRHRERSAAYRAKNPDLCNERICAWAKANPDKRVDQVNRRRAWKYGNGESEKFTRTEIGERDGWVCGICSDPIDKTLRFPDRQSQSLDHIVPL